MYRINILLALLFVSTISSAQENGNEPASDAKTEISNDFFGKKIDGTNAISGVLMSEEYGKLSASDTLSTKFTAKVLEVCQAKGCWMRLELNNGEEAMVKFKDYGFFVPNDITGREVVVNGNAFVNEMSVEEQKHYAKDGGKSEEEIAKITEFKKTYGFLADGILLRK